MNTIRSTWYGWGALMVAGGGAYYFAKREVNADRASRQEMELKRRRLAYQMEERERIEQASKSKSGRPPKAKSEDRAPNPSGEASLDPAPTRHTPEAREGRSSALPTPPEKSKFEPSEPYRSKRGDRFS